ncbi:hypothetical protein Aab01nite_08850 [Paractinoplanes abujensis]|uniref:DUF3592 domain-containing protein n=1 Tax=Paractinoplanes abujensis TaxID=882441 RepID=A0A7W7CMG6_9ACTN|nr:DUF3592 domain-containing protein [Actinoplanes abujensis]MBB4691290.1 hypothetical protein [Actinoplanes abujensis]GID17295.1 hypothetical protein Aab01nite_08850 [Actinoplanes abujensis]
MVLAVILVLVGLFVASRGVREWTHLRRLRSEGRHTVGTVTGHETKPGGSRAVIVAYTDELGTPRQLTSNLSSGVPTFAVGEPVTVRYLAGDPAGAFIDERRENARSLLLHVVLGLGFSAAGVALAVQD